VGFSRESPKKIKLNLEGFSRESRKSLRDSLENPAKIKKTKNKKGLKDSLENPPTGKDLHYNSLHLHSCSSTHPNL
jgi:hypothetical protein